ncbi:hypothetical protein AgCh_005591 [Apium graveolens]
MKGGLGFRDLYGFNIALLGKHCWNFINNPQSLVSRIYKERYFSNTTMLGVKKGGNPSFIWKGIMTAKTELQKGFRWIIGDGESINATKDPWIRLKADFCVENSHMYSGRDELVSAYIKQDTREWNIPLITEKFVSEDVQTILSVPIPQRRTRDRLVWSHSTTGVYSAKEGYKFWQKQANVGLVYDMQEVEDVTIWLLGKLSTARDEEVRKICTTLWGIWFWRNKKVWEDKSTTPAIAMDSSLKIVADWRDVVTPPNPGSGIRVVTSSISLNNTQS